MARTAAPGPHSPASPRSPNVSTRSDRLGGTEVLLSFDQHFIFTNRDASLHI